MSGKKRGWFDLFTIHLIGAMLWFIVVGTLALCMFGIFLALVYVAHIIHQATNWTGFVWFLAQLLTGRING